MIALYVEESPSKGKRKSRIRREEGTRTRDSSLAIYTKEAGDICLQLWMFEECKYMCIYTHTTQRSSYNVNMQVVRHSL